MSGRDCDRFVDRLLDGDVPAGDLQEHLDRCADCRGLRDRLSIIRPLGVAFPPAAPALAAAVHARLTRAMEPGGPGEGPTGRGEADGEGSGGGAAPEPAPGTASGTPPRGGPPDPGGAGRSGALDPLPSLEPAVGPSLLATALVGGGLVLAALFGRWNATEAPPHRGTHPGASPVATEDPRGTGPAGAPATGVVPVRWPPPGPGAERPIPPADLEPSGRAAGGDR